MRHRKIRLNRDKFTDFLAGVLVVIGIQAAWIAILLKL